MDASKLPMPIGVEMKKILPEGIRELCTYDPQSDGFIARWDTVINGKQFHVIEYQSSYIGANKIGVDEWLSRLRPAAIATLKEIEDHSTAA